ncbi:MAG: FGGY-family carbohydrate kinase, partial [[Clostridium] innocuum]
DHMYGHGGLFKTPEVGQKIMAAAMHAPVSVMTTAGEGGAWGSAVLAAYRLNRNRYNSLLDYLERNVFSQTQNCTIRASEELQEGFDSYIASYKKELFVERAAIRYLGSGSSAGQQEE